MKVVGAAPEIGKTRYLFTVLYFQISLPHPTLGPPPRRFTCVWISKNGKMVNAEMKSVPKDVDSW